MHNGKNRNTPAEPQGHNGCVPLARTGARRGLLDERERALARTRVEVCLEAGVAVGHRETALDVPALGRAVLTLHVGDVGLHHAGRNERRTVGNDRAALNS